MKISGKRFLHKINNKPLNDLSSTMSFLRVTIVALNKQYFKDVVYAFYE